MSLTLAPLAGGFVIIEFLEKVGALKVSIMLYACAVDELVAYEEGAEYDWLETILGLCYSIPSDQDNSLLNRLQRYHWPGPTLTSG